jgi:hypothetical protein
MSILPLDIQRRCERRWAARFSRPTEPVASQSQRPERNIQQIVRTDESKRNTQGVEAAGSMPLARAVGIVL